MSGFGEIASARRQEAIVAKVVAKPNSTLLHKFNGRTSSQSLEDARRAGKIDSWIQAMVRVDNCLEVLLHLKEYHIMF